MLPNTQKLTSQMAMMPDSALKQMAMMHKNDPYTLPLIIAEDSRRKEIRQAAMAKMAAPQINVADQDIAQIGTAPQMPMPQGAQQQLPEQQGIGALPAQNLERMADGGIAGYADGGPQQPGMFNYAQMAPAVDLHPNSGVTPRSMAAGGIAHFAGGSKEPVKEPIYPGMLPMQGGTLLPTTSGYEGRPLSDMFSDFGDYLSNIPKRISDTYEEKNLERKFKAQNKEKEKLYSSLMGTGRTPEGFAKTPRKDDTQIQSRKELDDIAAGKTPGGSTVGGNTGGGKKIQPIQSAPSTPEKDAYQEALDKYKPLDQKARQEMLKGYTDVSNKEMEEAYKPFADMNAKERDELKSRVESDKGEAILRAGLGMLGGSSPFALKNIGEGATAGLSALQEARKLTDAAKRANTQADLTLMQAQRAERSGNQKDAVALMNQQRQEEAHAVDLGLKALTAKDLSKYHDTAGKAALMQAGAAQTSAGAAVTRANALNSQYNDQTKLRAEYVKLQSAVLKSLQGDTTYASLPPEKQAAYRDKILREEMQRNPFLSAYASGIGFSQQPAGKVYDLTDDREDR